MTVLRSIVGLLLGILLSLIPVVLVGEDPLLVLRVIAVSAFQSKYDFGLMLYYATAFMFTGLSVSVAFRAGLFNIGAEGQLVIGALGFLVPPFFFPHLSFPFGFILSVFCALAAGGFWGWIAGYLRTKRGSHEVITTIMLNFVAAALVNYCITKPFRSGEGQSPESFILGPGYEFRSMDFLAKFFDDSPVNSLILVGIALCIFLWWVFRFTIWGHYVEITGQGEKAARVAGIPVDKTKQGAMILAGAFAALVAINEIPGGALKMKLGFSPEFGFTGIAVALLARAHPIGVIFSAFLFAILHKGAADLDIESERINRDIAIIMQALVILGVALSAAWKGKK